MRQMRNYRDVLIEELADAEIEETLSYLQVSLEEYQKDGYGDVLYLAYETAIKAQGGVQKFALKTHSAPQAVSDALLSKDEIQIAELLKKQVLAKRGKDKNIAGNEPLPKGWRVVKLGELCSDIAYGYTATASNEPIGPKFLRITDIVSDSINWAGVPYCEIEDSKKHRYTLEPGDIVIARTGATTGYNQVVRSNEHSVFASYLIRYKLRQDIAYPFFIGCVLKSTYWKRFVERIKARSAQPGANAKDFANFKIFLPTFPEQKAIASLLEKWDTAIEKTEALIEAKEKRFKWLLKTLISDQQDNPEWRQVKLVDACEVIVSPVDKKTVDGEFPVKLCNYTDVYYNNAIDSKINFMAATAKPREIEKFSIITDDVIITKDSETPDDIGVPAYVKETIDNLLCGYHLTILRPKKQTIGKYVCYALTSPRVKHDFYRFANGITRFGLTTESYQKIKIPLPLPSEQKRIANILDTAKEEVEFLNQLVEQYRTQKRGLMQKLLTGEWRVTRKKRKN